MNYYVAKADLVPYEGIVVNKDTTLTFENDKVKQKIENLELESETTIETKKFKSVTKMTVHLEEGEILLLEGEGRGYFLPAEPVDTIEKVIDDYKTLALTLDGDNNDIERNEEQSS